MDRVQSRSENTLLPEVQSLRYFVAELKHDGRWKRVGIFKVESGRAALNRGESIRTQHHPWADPEDFRVRGVPHSIYLLLVPERLQ